MTPLQLVVQDCLLGEEPLVFAIAGRSVSFVESLQSVPRACTSLLVWWNAGVINKTHESPRNC